MKIIVKSIPNKYKEKLEEDRANLEYENLGPISDDIIIYYQQSSEEKIKFVGLLYKRALISMKEPIETVVNGYRKHNNISNAIKNQHCSCLLCGIGPNPKCNSHVKERIAEHILELKPHRIVYGNFKGDYVPENIAMLCEECHNKEYKLIKKHCWNEFYNKDWKKLIEKSFYCFRWVIIKLDKQQESPNR